MDKLKIIEAIDKRLKEHKVEIDGVQRDLLDEKGKLKPKSVEAAAKLLALKDKMLFHKAAILVLEDLKKEIENEI